MFVSLDFISFFSKICTLNKVVSKANWYIIWAWAIQRQQKAGLVYISHAKRFLCFSKLVPRTLCLPIFDSECVV